MKILVLTSRYTATRDIVSEDFGRQTRLFEALKKLNHDIDFFVADYRKHENRNTKLHGINVMIRSFGILHFFHFINNFNKQLKTKKYDMLVASSDPLWGIIGYRAAKKHKVRFLYDLHDNYETYATYKIPFFGILDRIVVRKVDIVTAITHTLKNKISKIRKGRIFVIQNGVDTRLFRPMPRKKCRKALSLPENAKIIIYAGSIQRYEGVDRLIKMFDLLRKEVKNAYLVIAGGYVKGEERYINLKQKNVIYLGSLPQEKVVRLINAGDVAIIPYTNNNQVTYGFPYKLVEYMSCQAKIVATAVGDIKLILKNHKDSLCSPDSIVDMKNKIIKKLHSKNKKYNKKYNKELKDLTWTALAKKLDDIIKKC